MHPVGRPYFQSATRLLEGDRGAQGALGEGGAHQQQHVVVPGSHSRVVYHRGRLREGQRQQVEVQEEQALVVGEQPQPRGGA